MPTITMQVTGLTQLLAKAKDASLIAVPWKHAMTKIVLTIHDEAFQRTPRATGTLQRSLTTQVDPAPFPMWGKVGTNLSYAPMVHFGTKAHDIRPRGKRALYWKGARHPVRVVHHPGTKPHPFLTDGFKAAKGKISTILKQCGEEIKTRWLA